MIGPRTRLVLGMLWMLARVAIALAVPVVLMVLWWVAPMLPR